MKFVVPSRYQLRLGLDLQRDMSLRRAGSLWTAARYWDAVRGIQHVSVLRLSPAAGARHTRTSWLLQTDRRPHATLHRFLMAEIRAGDVVKMLKGKEDKWKSLVPHLVESLKPMAANAVRSAACSALR